MRTYLMHVYIRYVAHLFISDHDSLVCFTWRMTKKKFFIFFHSLANFPLYACIAHSIAHIHVTWLIHSQMCLDSLICLTTGWRRLIGSPKLQIIFHKRATKYTSLLRKITYKDKGSYESSPPCRPMAIVSLLKLFHTLANVLLYACMPRSLMHI